MSYYQPCGQLGGWNCPFPTSRLVRHKSVHTDEPRTTRTHFRVALTIDGGSRENDLCLQTTVKLYVVWISSSVFERSTSREVDITAKSDGLTTVVDRQLTACITADISLCGPDKRSINWPKVSMLLICKLKLQHLHIKTGMKLSSI